MSDLASALNAQGMKYLLGGDNRRSMDFFRFAITHDPTLADAYTNLGVAQTLEQQYADAVVAQRQSLTLRPDHPETLLNLGYTLTKTLDFASAEVVLRRAIEVADSPRAHIALGSVYYELGENDLAIKHSLLGLANDPDNVIGHCTLREVYHFSGDEDKAWEEGNELVRLAPEYPEHRHKRSLIMLSHGKPEGWAEHEFRCDYSPDGLSTLARENAPFFAKLFGKRWEGQKTEHLLVQTEQGYGDVIQFLRFIPLAAERCERLTLHLAPPLRRLAKQTFKHLNVDVCECIPDEFDHYCLIMSLAHLLDCTTDVPLTPYLAASHYKFDEIRRLRGPKIGLAWTGSNKHPENRYRLMAFEKMAQLLEFPAHFVSLQHPCDVNLTQHPIIDVHLTPTIFDGHLLVDWTETAALIDTLDLVISTDTAVPHLAAALDKPVWLLNRYNSDWRWMLHRSDAPWYPSMKIFRQPKMGDWDSVLTTVRHELTKFINDFQS